jgi:hypothetical protein
MEVKQGSVEANDTIFSHNIVPVDLLEVPSIDDLPAGIVEFANTYIPHAEMDMLDRMQYTAEKYKLTCEHMCLIVGGEFTKDCLRAARWFKVMMRMVNYGYREDCREDIRHIWALCRKVIREIKNRCESSEFTPSEDFYDFCYDMRTILKSSAYEELRNCIPEIEPWVELYEQKMWSHTYPEYLRGLFSKT